MKLLYKYYRWRAAHAKSSDDVERYRLKAYLHSDTYKRAFPGLDLSGTGKKPEDFATSEPATPERKAWRERAKRIPENSRRRVSRVEESPNDYFQSIVVTEELPNQDLSVHDEEFMPWRLR